MEERRFGKTGRTVSRIGFGAWAIGGSWGTVDDAESLRALHASADAGVTLYDTADVYGDGRSERLIGRFLKERRDPRIFVATKVGRRVPLDPASYTPSALRAWIDRCRENLGVERLDLVQLHCLPTPTYYQPELFAAMDAFVADGSIAAYGVSVEKVEEAIKALLTRATDEVDRLNNQLADPVLKQRASLISELRQQIEALQSNRDYQKLDADPYKLPPRILLLAHLLDNVACFNCKSGKDRTGMVDIEVKALVESINACDQVWMMKAVTVAIKAVKRMVAHTPESGGLWKPSKSEAIPVMIATTAI